MKHEITLKLKVNAWVICGVLLFSNLLLIGLWHPWTTSSTNTRQITVTGISAIEAEPNQYVFSPYYQKTGVDKTKLNSELSELTKTITDKLKNLKVADSEIKTNVSINDYDSYNKDSLYQQLTATLYLTVTLKDKALAQTVQDYLATTDYSGTITPNASFSTAKQTKLETSARISALLDAKAKAEASVKQLGARLGRVARISELSSNNFMPIMYSESKGAEIGTTDRTTSSYTLQPGLNEYNFSIEVTYDLN